MTYSHRIEVLVTFYTLAALTLLPQKSVAQPVSLASEPVATNHVLELDGEDSYVDLPAHIFDDQEAITVEAWVKWQSFGNWSRVFDFGNQRKAILVGNRAQTQDLEFEVWPDPVGCKRVRAAGILRSGEWCHIAAVADQNGLRLHFNGVEVGSASWTGPLWSEGGENIIQASQPSAQPVPVPNGERNYVGRSNWHDAAGQDSDFHGQMDEFRVWQTGRTTEQIQDNMFRRLRGDEPGLVALYNFDEVTNGVVKDFSPGKHDGKLIGNARVVSARLPGPGQMQVPTIVLGTVGDETGKPPTNATVRLWHGNEAITAPASSDPDDGRYFIMLFSEYESFDVEATAGDLGTWKMGVVCPRGQRTEVNLTLANAVSIAGQVTAFDGSLIPDVVVQVVRAAAPTAAPGSLATPGLVATKLTTGIATNAQNYQFLSLRPGDYKVRIHLPDTQLEYHQGEVLHVEPGRTLTANFQVAPFRKGRWPLAGRSYSLGCAPNTLPSGRI